MKAVNNSSDNRNNKSKPDLHHSGAILANNPNLFFSLKLL